MKSMMDRRDNPPIKTGMVIQLLDGFSISNDQETISSTRWKSRRARSLVKLLALTPGHRLHRDQLIDVLWPDMALAAATNNFHQALYAARRVLDQVLPGCLVLDEGFLSLSGGQIHAFQVDVEVFEAAASHTRESHDPAAYQAALELYTGDLLPEDRYEEWTLQPREALRQTFLQLSLDLAKVKETRQEYPGGIAALLRLLALDPSHEEAHCELMRLYALSGQRQKALRQYQTLRDVLRSELEVDPSPATLQLYELIQSGRISQSVETLAPAEPSPPDAAPLIGRKARHNLPNRLSTFIGREREIDQVIALLRGTRLLTITGAGGVGKTSLALQAVGYLLEVFPDGVWLVDLAPLANPELVPQACVHTLELMKQPDTPYLPALIQYLQKKHLLLILDNCEHLLAACTNLAAELLKSCPKLTILATSREILNLAGESAFRVPSMTVPDSHLEMHLDQMAQYESVRLFVERARQISPEFSLTRDNAPAIALICQRLDGIPLAIELAAGRVRVLAVEQIAARLQQTFHLLTGRCRAVLPRQQTLKATIDWSYDLLTPKERLLLQRLSVFAGGWTLEAAELVCPDDTGLGMEVQETRPHIESEDVLDLLTSLVDKSLVIAAEGESGMRYRMLETIRQYAHDRLEEAGGEAQGRDRHLVYYAGLTGQAEPHLRGKGQIEWLDRLESELDNLRAAVQWSQAGRIELGLKIAADLMWFWWLRGFYTEGRKWLETLLSKEESSRKTQSSDSETNRILQRARGLRAYAFGNRWNILFTDEERIAMLEQSVGLLRRLGLPARRELAISLYYVQNYKDDLEQPSPEKKELFEIFQQENMRFYYSNFIFNLGTLLLNNSELSQAKVYLEESLSISREIEDLDGIASCAKSLGMAFMYEGNYQRAEMLVRESIEISHLVKNRWWEARCYLGLIQIELAQGRYEEAAQHGQEVRSVYLDVKEQGRSVFILDVLQSSAWSRGDYEEAFRLGMNKRDLHMESELTNYLLARIALSQKELNQAEILFKKVMSDFRWNRTEKTQFLEGAAVLFNLQVMHCQAIRLFGAVDDIYKLFRLGLPLRERSENEEALASARSALGEEAFAVAWKEGQAMTLEQAGDCALDELG
jgi:predicted ATPase/DNA-binding SARP family transcriptional activator